MLDESSGTSPDSSSIVPALAGQQRFRLHHGVRGAELGLLQRKPEIPSVLPSCARMKSAL